ncbi:MAG: hypothetical protein IJR50_05880 [Treponema sp.]|nr:hypothetical protein [Treponema sp.]
MINHIGTSILKSFSSAGKAVMLAAACVLTGCAIVYPLWLFATAQPLWYTRAVLMLITMFVVYKIVAAVKKSSWKSMVRAILHSVILIGGAALVVFFVFNELRIIAIFIALLTPAAYIACSHFFSNTR